MLLELPEDILIYPGINPSNSVLSSRHLSIFFSKSDVLNYRIYDSTAQVQPLSLLLHKLPTKCGRAELVFLVAHKHVLELPPTQKTHQCKGALTGKACQSAASKACACKQRIMQHTTPMSKEPLF
jgi:hypothetical protein